MRHAARRQRPRPRRARQSDRIDATLELDPCPLVRTLQQRLVHDQWLHLREIDATSPDTKLFPEFDDYLK